MQTILEKVFDATTFRQEGHQLIEILANYFSEITQPSDEKVIDYLSPTEQLAFWKEDTSKDSTLSDFFKKIIANNIHLHHPHYLGHQVSTVAPISALAELLGAFLNSGVGVYEMGSPMVALEKIVCEKLCEQLGYPASADGFLTSGGTLGNLTALLTARSKKSGVDIWASGNQNQRLAVMVSEEAHYCIDRAVRIMGWGAEGIIKIPVNAQFQMKTDLLESYYQEAKAKGIEVIAVVGSACSTSTGSYDNLEEIAFFCQKHGLWFHVDGAHGGAVIFSQTYQHLTKGMEKADSLIIDLHKMLLTPALCTAVLFKESHHAYQTFAQKAQYLWDNQEEEWFNLGKRTFECTKNSMVLRFYVLLRQYGADLFEVHINKLYQLAKDFAQMIKEEPELELCVDPQSNIVCFRWKGEGLDDESLNYLNHKIRRDLVEEGDFFIVQTQIKQKTYLRTTLMNPLTDANVLKKLVQKIKSRVNEYDFSSLKITTPSL